MGNVLEFSRPTGDAVDRPKAHRPNDAIEAGPGMRQAAQVIARQEVADAVAAAMSGYEGSSRDFERETGIDPAVISRMLNGRHKNGGTVATLAQVALALGKTLRITID